MKKTKIGAGALLSPAPPAMVTCRDENGRANIITIAWTGILCTRPPKTYISVRPERFSYNIIKNSGEFIINLTSSDLVKKADLCGMKTGRKIDKFKECNLTEEEAEGFSAPMIAESPMSLCCRVCDVIPLGSHDMFLADIESIYVDETLFDKNGKLRLDRADLCAFSHGEYFKIGEKIGNFGFSVAKKKSKKPHNLQKNSVKSSKNH